MLMQYSFCTLFSDTQTLPDINWTSSYIK